MGPWLKFSIWYMDPIWEMMEFDCNNGNGKNGSMQFPTEEHQDAIDRFMNWIKFWTGSIKKKSLQFKFTLFLIFNILVNALVIKVTHPLNVNYFYKCLYRIS